MQFYTSIHLRPKIKEKIVLDPKIVSLSQMLFVGLVLGDYPPDWLAGHFYFDVRGFYFLHRTNYFPQQVLDYLAEKPFRHFPVDPACFQNKLSLDPIRISNRRTKNWMCSSFNTILRIVESKKGPMILGIAGPTAAGKTEIVERLTFEFTKSTKKYARLKWTIS